MGRSRTDSEWDEARAGRHADPGREPDRRSRRETSNVGAPDEDDSRTDEPDAGDYLRRDAGRIEVDGPFRHDVAEAELADDREHRGPDAHERVRPQASILLPQFAFEADKSGQA